MTLRLALLSLAAILVAPALSAQQPPVLSEADQQLAHDLFKQLIEINTTDSIGSTTLAAEAMRQRLLAAGFPAADLTVLGPNDRKGNLVARYRGKASSTLKPILIIGHTDVVEARREDWTTDPFQFIEKDGYFYGRGTQDMKSADAIMVADFIRLKREGYVPDRDLILALTADEEGGGQNGVRWLIENHRDLIAADYAFNEGGGGEMVNGKPISLNVQLAEKYVMNIRVEVRNKGGHSSVPVPDNAIYQLAEALSKLSKFSFPLKTNDVTRNYFAQIAKTETGPDVESLKQIGEGSVEAMRKVAAEYPKWNSMLRTTCVATMLEGGHASNALPQLAAATVNCRVMPDDAPEYVLKSLQDAIGDQNVKVTTARLSAPGPSSTLRPDVMKQISRITDSLWPGVIVVPSMSTGATDGKALRAIGIETYGVSGLFGERGDSRAHGKDERMLAKSFYQAQLFLYELVKACS